MAFLVTTIIVEVADDLVNNLPAAQENLIHFTEGAIRNSLFGDGYMPDDVEIDSWSVSSKWINCNSVRVLMLSMIEAETLKQISNDLFENLPGTGDYNEDEDYAIWSIIRKVKEL